MTSETRLQARPGGSDSPNIILILIDSLNRHHLPPYGFQQAEASNIDRFAARSWRFDNHFVGSLPCMPARREILGGFKEMMWRPWGPLESFDQRLPKILSAAKYTTAIVTDHYHYWEEAGNGYIQAFDSADLIRGHEFDFWRNPLPEEEDLPKWVENIERWRPGDGRRYYANVRDFTSEEDFFPAKVMTQAAEWLDASRDRDPFFLQIESFDVHEPFHVPEPYASMFGDGTDYERFCVWPPYQDVEQQAAFATSTSNEELAFILSQYLGKLAMVDHWVGRVLETLDRLHLWDTTAVLLTTDHGHDLGERGTFGKSYPHFDTHANIPLFIWDPRRPGNGKSIDSLTSTVDLFSTILDLAGVEPTAPHGKSLLPTIRGGSSHQEGVLYGTFGQGVCCTDGKWSLFKSPASHLGLYSYSSLYYQSLLVDELAPPEDQGHFIPGVTPPQWQVPVSMLPRSREDFLFDRIEDPGQTRNLWFDAPDKRSEMLHLLQHLMETEGTPSEQYARLGLPEPQMK